MRVIWCMFFGLIALGLVSGAARAAETVLVLSSSGPEYQAIAAGFKGSFGGTLREINLEGSEEKQRKVGEELKAKPPAAAVVVGDLAVQMAKWYIPDVPVVYCDSVRAPMISLSQGKAVGIYHETDPADQLSVLARLFPGKKHVGLIYCPEYAAVNEKSLAASAAAKGITLEMMPLASIKEMPVKLQVLIPKVEMLWVLTDPAVLSSHSTQYLVLQAISAGLPIFCGNADLAHGGATAALVPDLADVGAKAAREAAGINSGKAPAPGAVIYPKGKTVINLKSAAMLKIALPSDAAASADEVIN